MYVPTGLFREDFRHHHKLKLIKSSVLETAPYFTGFICVGRVHFPSVIESETPEMAAVPSRLSYLTGH